MGGEGSSGSGYGRVRWEGRAQGSGHGRVRWEGRAQVGVVMGG